VLVGLNIDRARRGAAALGNQVDAAFAESALKAGVQLEFGREQGSRVAVGFDVQVDIAPPRAVSSTREPNRRTRASVPNACATSWRTASHCSGVSRMGLVL